MIYPEKMSFITLASQKGNLEPVIDTLYDLKLLHVDDNSKHADLPAGKPLEGAEKVSELLLDINFIKGHVSLGEARARKTDIETSEKVIKNVKGQINRLLEERAELSRKSLEHKKTIKDMWFMIEAGINDSSLLWNIESLGFLACHVKSPSKIESILEGTKCEVLHSQKRRAEYPVLIFAEKKDIEKIRAKINAHVVFHNLEKIESRDLRADIAELREKRRIIKEDMKAMDQKVAEAGRRYNAQLVASEKFLRESLKKAEAPLKFAVGDHSFLASGWVPSRDVPRLRNGLKGMQNIYLEVEEGVHDGPTKLANPKSIRSFEFFLNLYSLPKLNEIDPTFLVFLSFPIFYGMMLGDIGYGLILYAVFSIVRWKKPRYKGLCDIILLSSIFTMIFGFAFGEFFGAEEIFGTPLVSWIHRLHDIEELLLVSIAFGLVHLNLGFVFGFVNELRHHGVRKAVFAKGSWMLLEFAGIFLILDYYFGIAMIDRLLGFGLVLLSVIMLFLGEGVVGLIEIPGLISSVLSYARLAAVGLASASLALVVNSMAGSMFAAGGFFIAIGGVILVMGHAINIMLGLLDAFLQSLRLHYVEMFTKFYGGNGKPYNPFGR